MSTVAHPSAKGYRTMRLPIAEADYERFLGDGAFAREQLAEVYEQHPELFPGGWEQGYVYYGFTSASRKQGQRCRRVRLRASGEVFTVAPAFLMPYLRATVAEVEKAVFLMRFHVPCWALAYVFGRDAM